MKKIMLVVLSTVVFTAAAFAADTPKKEVAPNTPEWFILHNCEAPDSRTEDKPGEVVFKKIPGAIIQTGSSLTAKEAYNLYCQGGSDGN